jgi:general secretion pathway protein M
MIGFNAWGQMKAYWLNLSDRDRLVLSVGGVVVGVYLFYALIYSPLTNAVATQSQLWMEKKETMAWMDQQKNRKALPQKVDSNLLSVFSEQLKRASFSKFAYQLQQIGDENIQLSFETVPYVDFLAWLKQLQDQYRMKIKELTVARTQTAGIVKLSVVVEK